MCPPQTCEARESLLKTLNQTYNYCLSHRLLFLLDVTDQILLNNISVAGKIILYKYTTTSETSAI